MTDAAARVAPNPHSPYADANPDTRHMIQQPAFFPDPAPGVLALVACGRMAVVPTEVTEITAQVQGGRIGELPPGLCADCVRVGAGDGKPLQRVPGVCRECRQDSSHGDLCAMRRQDLHEQWWPTRDQEGTAR